MTESAEMSAGMPLGEKPVDVTEPSASGTGTDTGLKMAALGSSSTRTSVASPQVRPVSACRFDRPTDQAGYCPVMPSVSDTTSNSTAAHPAIARGECSSIPSLVGRQGFSPRLEKWK